MVCGRLHGDPTSLRWFNFGTSFSKGPSEPKRVGTGDLASSKALIGFSRGKPIKAFMARTNSEVQIFLSPVTDDSTRREGRMWWTNSSHVIRLDLGEAFTSRTAAARGWRAHRVSLHPGFYRDQGPRQISVFCFLCGHSGQGTAITTKHYKSGYTSRLNWHQKVNNCIYSQIWFKKKWREAAMHMHMMKTNTVKMGKIHGWPWLSVHSSKSVQVELINTCCYWCSSN